jgi:excisionase family DNA binding protein
MRSVRGVLSVAEAADRLGRNPETVRRWIRSGRLPARRVGARHAIDDCDLRVIEDELHPMSELPEEWRIGDDGTLAPNWVAALHRSRSGHLSETSVESGISDVVGYLQEVLGQKLVAHIAGVSDLRTVARWSAGGRTPRAEHEQRLRCAYQTFHLLLAEESPSTVRAWFLKLNPQLDDQSPAQSIREGNFRDVLDAAKEFLAGG